MTKINAYAAWSHYADHIAPIWDRLDNEHKGQFVVPSQTIKNHLANWGIEATLSRSNGQTALALRNNEPMIVAGYSDLVKMSKRPIVFVEHGAGQTYVREDGSIHGGYSGGRNRNKVGLFICPNNEVAKRNLDAYPSSSVAVVGSPRLDDLFLNRRVKKGFKTPTIGVSFHWDCQIAPESGSAFGEFSDQMKDFLHYSRVCGYDVVGHGHPKAWNYLFPYWLDQKVDVVKEWDQVVKRIDVLFIDNSSIIFEAAALDIPVVLMESAKWRKGVSHGLRFWDYADVGPVVRPNESLAEGLAKAFDPIYAERRREVARSVYAIQPDSGHLSSRSAALAILEWVKEQGIDG